MREVAESTGASLSTVKGWVSSGQLTHQPDQRDCPTRVVTLRLPGYDLQVGVRLRKTMAPRLVERVPEKWRWAVVNLVDDHASVPQCWSGLVDWVYGSPWEGLSLRELRLRDVLPWSHLRPTCREDAQQIGTCYCGRVVRADVAAGRDDLQRSVVVVPVADEGQSP